MKLKTIEAGLILSEYLARGMIQSILVLTPASLLQWQLELSEKFNIDTITTDWTHDNKHRRIPDRAPPNYCEPQQLNPPNTILTSPPWGFSQCRQRTTSE